VVLLHLIELVLARHPARHLHFDGDHEAADTSNDVGQAALLVFVAVELYPLATKKPTQPFQDTPDKPSLWLFSH
jgi:hypothetical protein